MKLHVVLLIVVASTSVAQRRTPENQFQNLRIPLPVIGYDQGLFPSNIPQAQNVIITRISKTFPRGFGTTSTSDSTAANGSGGTLGFTSAGVFTENTGTTISGATESFGLTSQSISTDQAQFGFTSQGDQSKGTTLSLHSSHDNRLTPFTFDKTWLHDQDEFVSPFPIIPLNIPTSDQTNQEVFNNPTESTIETIPTTSTQTFNNQTVSNQETVTNTLPVAPGATTVSPPGDHTSQQLEPIHFIFNPPFIQQGVQTFPVNPIYHQVVPNYATEVPVLSLHGQEEEALQQEWIDFRNRFNKAYATEAEEKYRREIFFENRAKIIRFNTDYANGRTNIIHKINEFADQLHHEFTQNFNGFNRSSQAPSMPLKQATAFLPSANVVFPSSIDWSMVGAVGPVKSQGKCAACWAFAAAGALEGHHFRKTGNLVEISVQNLIDCTAPYGNNGCSGGLMDPAFEYVRDNNGVDSEQSYPFEERMAECRFRRENVVATCTGFVDIGENDEQGLEIAIATLGPVTAAIDAGQDTFQFYSEGIYDDPACGNKPEQMNHAVLIVGYGQEPDGRKYWLVKNSYGPSWGIGGYIKIAKNNNNQCGIAIKASYPLV